MGSGSSSLGVPPIFLPHETVLFQGDSITDGNRGRNADPNHILGHGYVFTIASKYGATYPTWGLTFLNRGISGNRVHDLATRWDADTLALNPDVLSILIGVNDVYFAFAQHQAFDAKSVYDEYDRLLESTLKARPKLKLILGEPFILDVGQVSATFPDWRKAIDEIDAAVQRLADKYHAPVVHFQKVFNDATQLAPADHWIWDGIHPTYSGHQLMADAWIKAYNDFYVSPLQDPARNSAINPVVNYERDSYDWLHRLDDVVDLQKQGNPDIVMIGDSITHFWGGEPKDPRVNGPESWKATFGSKKVVNMGCGWDRTQNVLWRLQHGEFHGITPKSVILNIGTNNLVGDDTARTNTPEETAVGIERIVDLVQQRSPSSKIFVMAVFPRGFEKGNDLDRRITELNNRVKAALQNRAGVTVLDIGNKLRSADGAITPKIMSDGTHPTDLGYSFWGQALKDAGAIP
jgi:lysophospholipase L1-like esterase